jgi:hypothetical protein
VRMQVTSQITRSQARCLLVWMTEGAQLIFRLQTKYCRHLLTCEIRAEA